MEMARRRGAVRNRSGKGGGNHDAGEAPTDIKAGMPQRKLA